MPFPKAVSFSLSSLPSTVVSTVEVGLLSFNRWFLQIGETMVLQRVELEGEASSSHFLIFGPLAALMGNMVSQKNFTQSRKG
jgi:hypothetical protein